MKLYNSLPHNLYNIPMRVILQRVKAGGVVTEGRNEKISEGLVILLGVATDDSEADADYLAEKISSLRIFSDENDRFNFSITDIKGEALVISQFTLFADTLKGRRPDFTKAARPEKAVPLYEYFCSRLAAAGIPVKTGVFGASMQVEIHNNGPVTVFIDSRQKIQHARDS